jgi:hypothetical protein
MQDSLDVVLVIRPVHRAGTVGYDYIPVEVSRFTAEQQLNLEEAKRHITWRGVRYASDEEKRTFYGIENQIEESIEIMDTIIEKPNAKEKLVKQPKVK